MTEAPQTRVGFIGLGTMGGPMVANIARAGYPLAVHDVDPAVTVRVADEIGASAAVEVSDFADREVVVLMLPTSAIVRAALFTEEGILRTPFTAGTVIVDMSSSDPTDTVETGRLLTAAGIHLVDAPVSGAKERAAAGTLSIMMGADDEAAAQKAIPVIEAMSDRIFRTGKLGSGHAVKALNNFLAAASFVAASEALNAGIRFGVDPNVLLDVFNASTGQSFATSRVIGPHVVEGQYKTGFALPLITKDVRIASTLQRTVGGSAPVCDAVEAQLESALEELGNVDYTRAYEAWSHR